MVLSTQPRKKLKRTEIISYITACGLGVLFHFIYDCSGKLRILVTTIDWINIVIYLISMAIAYIYGYRQFTKTTPFICNPTVCIVLFTIIAILFMIFTVFPHGIGLFAITLPK